MRWIVRAKHKELDEHLNLITSDLEVYYDGKFKFVAWLVYRWLSWNTSYFPVIIMCNQHALEVME